MHQNQQAPHEWIMRGLFVNGMDRRDYSCTRSIFPTRKM